VLFQSWEDYGPTEIGVCVVWVECECLSFVVLPFDVVLNFQVGARFELSGALGCVEEDVEPDWEGWAVWHV
jgi:hypothetical protein